MVVLVWFASGGISLSVFCFILERPKNFIAEYFVEIELDLLRLEKRLRLAIVEEFVIVGIVTGLLYCCFCCVGAISANIACPTHVDGFLDFDILIL